MVKADSSATIAGGDVIATHTIDGKEHQVFMPADFRGHLIGSRDEFVAYYAGQTNAVNRSVADLFNADAALIVKVRGIWLVPTMASVTGVQIQYDLNRVTAVGTGGTAITPRPLDTNFTALDADVTARRDATGGNTLDYLYWSQWFLNDETNPGYSLAQMLNLLPQIGDTVPEIVLRQNQGIQLKQITSTTTGATGALIYFVME